ncbi:DUF3854 domain-containing protein [Nostoc sphaeroides]|uniref:DUF3854 domain-containing protein n=1 Tax=Nostoc sphaeroides CCNUC1 TaxID=2653204 RepID=A0A5P8WF86_9NOSO|nr:hypothetical protein GXM_08989 [Nostoc sphaeroides CCNUC1]
MSAITIPDNDFHQKHQQEWLNSCVDEEIIALNARSLYGTTPYEYLLYSPKISRRNDGRLRDRDLKKYQHIELGGWWCSGVDPLNDYIAMMWGCFKPDHPRRDRQKIHKFIKYEHPFREETRAFFLLVPNRIWVKVSNRTGIPITEEDLQHPGGFWHWVWRHNVPVTIVEGVKKAGALLTAGYAAIAQKLLAKIDLKLNYVGRLGKRENRECVYQFVAPDDERDSIFGQWLNRDELFQNELVSVSNNIVLPTPMIDTTSQLIPKNTDLVSVTNNIEFPTQVTDTISHGIPLSLNQVESPVNQGWKGLKLKLQQGMDCAGSFYNELVSTIGEAVGVADGEPFWNGYLGQWQVWVNFASGCKSVVCDWLVVV